MTDIQELVAEQAEDEGLWFIAQTAPEAYLQAALRRLHALIERDQPSQSSEFSEFIRNASPERQAEVFGRVLDEASAEQRDAVQTRHEPGCSLCDDPLAWMDKWDGKCPRCSRVLPTAEQGPAADA